MSVLSYFLLDIRKPSPQTSSLTCPVLGVVSARCALVLPEDSGQ